MGKPAAKKNSLTKWDAELANLAAAAVRTEEHVGAGSNAIKLAGGRMTFKGAEVPGNKMNVVIVDHCLENAFYKGKYDPSNPTTPVCYAFGRENKGMAPHADSPEPQSKECNGCPNNEYGSADTGKGKACKNIHRLAIITQGDLDDVEAAEVAFLKPPPTSGKAWAGYVRQLAEVLKRPPLGVITEISVIPDAKSQFICQFKLIEKIDDSEVLGAVIDKNKDVARTLMSPYIQIEAAPPTARRAKANAKFAGKGR